MLVRTRIAGTVVYILLTILTGVSDLTHTVVIIDQIETCVTVSVTTVVCIYNTLLYDYYMVIIWLVYGCYMSCIWLLYDYYMVII